MSESEVRLLLVDDHPMVREGLRARLSHVAQFRVVDEAGSANEALQSLARHDIHLVLMDIGMKPVNGIDLTAQVLARWPRLKVLMFSMYDNPEFVQRALQAGASGYLLKDAPADEIVAAIGVVMSGATFLSPGVSGRLFRNDQPKPLLSPREAEECAGPGRIQQADGGPPGPELSHRGGTPPEHQAQAGHRRPGRVDQVRGGACGRPVKAAPSLSTGCQH
jgi:DNA-binding NarL/FixJ family response regulator